MAHASTVDIAHSREPAIARVRREPAPALEAGPVATGDRCRAAATGVYYFLYSYLLLFILHDLLSCFLVWTPVVDVAGEDDFLFPVFLP